MNSAEAILSVISAIETAGIAYMVTGSLASGVWGIPRSSKDADLVLEMTQRHPDEVMRHLGPEFVLDDQMSFESITGSMRWIVHVPSISFDIELFLLGKDEHHQDRFKRRRVHKHPILLRDVFLPSAEDVIIQKVRWGREKDRSDAVDVMSVQNEHLDWHYIEFWCDRHNTRKLMEELRAKIPAD